MLLNCHVTAAMLQVVITMILLLITMFQFTIASVNFARLLILVFHLNKTVQTNFTKSKPAQSTNFFRLTA
jgi:hypothetical protein